MQTFDAVRIPEMAKGQVVHNHPNKRGVVTRLAFSTHQPVRRVADAGEIFEGSALAAIAARGTDDPISNVK